MWRVHKPLLYNAMHWNGGYEVNLKKGSRRLTLLLGAVGVLFPQFFLAQTKEQRHTLPSSAEILELANKADEKVHGFEMVLQEVAPELDKDTVQTDQDAAKMAHTIIAMIRNKGASTYSIVGLLSILDDLTLDASRASRIVLFSYTKNLVNGNQPSNVILTKVIALTDAETSLHDISDLWLHMALRYVAATDDLMEQLFEKLK
jgi:hypothetical protein